MGRPARRRMAPRARLFGIAEAFERYRRSVRELDREPKAPAHGLDVAAQGRDHEIAALLELGDRGLADAQALRELRLCQIPCLAEILERLIFAMESVGLGLDPRAPLGCELRHLVLQCGAHRLILSLPRDGDPSARPLWR